MYVDNLDDIKKRYVEYWHKENHDRPLLSLYAKKSGVTPKEIPMHAEAKENWWDTELIIKKARSRMEATSYMGEAHPMLWPNLGPDIFAAFLGADIIYENMDTSWAVNFVRDWDDHHFQFDENNIYWRKIVEMTQAFLDDSKGDYMVGLTDIHQAMDCLVSVRGPENVCMDLYDCPEKIHTALIQVEKAFKEVINRSYSMITAKQKGISNWMGIYHPETCYVTSMDFIYLISPAQFDEFAGPAIRREAEIIGNNVFHLDGVGSLTHLDKLLAMPEIHGIQWVYGAGKPTAAHWIDILKRIQDAGKLIVLDCAPNDMPAIFASELKPEGVHYSVWCENEAQCERVMADAYETYRKKLY